MSKIARMKCETKRRIQMTSIKRTLVALTAALAISSVAVGAAVGPAQAASAPVEVSLYA
jgi:hypothetical protein